MNSHAVLTVVHLIFTTGHTAPSGDQLMRADLVQRALARMLQMLLPDNPNVAGLLALLLLTDARRASRTDDDGHLQLLADQDRSLWDRAAIAEGLQLVRQSLRRTRPSRWSLTAAIAAVHGESPSWEQTDWADLAAARADFLRRLGRTREARTAYTEALMLTGNTVERRFLASRLDELGPGDATASPEQDSQ